jgi:hypothetical protein
MHHSQKNNNNEKIKIKDQCIKKNKIKIATNQKKNIKNIYRIKKNLKMSEIKKV